LAINNKDFEYFKNLIAKDNLSVKADATCQMYRTEISNIGIVVSKDAIQHKVIKVLVCQGGVKLFENEYADQLAKLCEQRVNIINQKTK